MKKVKIWICGILLIVIAGIWVNNIPIRTVYPILKQASQIDKIYLEVNGPEGDDRSYNITDQAQIAQICTLLQDVRLGYRGAYSEIPYGAYDGDYIVIMHLNSRDNRVYLRGNGTLYDGKSRFQAKDDAVTALFQYLVENYYGNDNE